MALGGGLEDRESSTASVASRGMGVVLGEEVRRSGRGAQQHGAVKLEGSEGGVYLGRRVSAAWVQCEVQRGGVVAVGGGNTVRWGRSGFEREGTLVAVRGIATQGEGILTRREGTDERGEGIVPAAGDLLAIGQRYELAIWVTVPSGDMGDTERTGHAIRQDG